MNSVTPYAGVWIETPNRPMNTYRLMSLPTRERGLKLLRDISLQLCNTSLPTRECGLKPIRRKNAVKWYAVTPYAGVWIETQQISWLSTKEVVTPYAGVWIET